MTFTDNPSRLAQFLSRLRRFHYLYCLFNRRDELIRLSEWAEKRRFTGPLQAYYKERHELERSLMNHVRLDRELVSWVRTVHKLTRWLTPEPTYRKKGSRKARRR